MMSYRGIHPVPTYESEIHPVGLPQFFWHKHSEGLEAAMAGGKEVLLCINDDGHSYALTYLDMQHPEAFSTVDEAKAAAPDFVRAVLFRMLCLVGTRPDDHSLNDCLARGGQ